MSFDLRDLDSIPDPLAGASQRELPAQSLPKTPALTRRAVQRRRLLAVAISFLWMGAILAFFGVRDDFFANPLVLAHVALPALFGGAALYTALSSGPAGVGPSIRPTLVFALLGPIAFVVTAMLLPTVEASDHFLRSVFICGDVVLFLGAIPLAALAWSLRHACVSSAPWRSTLVAVAVGLVAAAAAGSHCTNTDRLHIALGHGLPILVLALMGWFVVRRVTRV